MEGLITNFRGGRHTKYDNQMIVSVKGYDTKKKSEQLLQKKITWKTPSGKTITGHVSNVHGNNGAVRVLFDTGMPGQSIGTTINIEG